LKIFSKKTVFCGIGRPNVLSPENFRGNAPFLIAVSISAAREIIDLVGRQISTADGVRPVSFPCLMANHFGSEKAAAVFLFDPDRLPRSVNCVRADDSVR
jgi:hypothetical protein